MKKITLIAGIFLLALTGVFAQDAPDAAEKAKAEKNWKFGGMGGLTLTQTGLVNWSGGGSSNLMLIGRMNLFANMKKKGHVWDNSLDLGYGLLKDNLFYDPKGPITKAEDRIELNSKWGHQFKPKSKWYYSALFQWITQFAPGFQKPADQLEGRYISKFMSPGYFKFALGIDFKPNDEFTLFLSPLSTKITVVIDDSLAAANAFGVNQVNKDGEITPGAQPEHARFELGALVRMQYKKDLIKDRVGFDTKLELFSNYLFNPQYIDVDWQTAIVAKINDYIAVNLFTHLIYDWDVNIGLVDNKGVPKVDAAGNQEQGKRIQFKEIFGVGFSYKFGGAAKK